jgi:hypothetical protein
VNQWELLIETYELEYRRLRRWAARFLPDTQARGVARSSLAFLFYCGCRLDETVWGPYARLYWFASTEVKRLCGALNLHCPELLEGSFPLPSHADCGTLIGCYTSLYGFNIIGKWTMEERADIRLLMNNHDPQDVWIYSAENWLSTPGPGRFPLRRVFDLFGKAPDDDGSLGGKIMDAIARESLMTDRWYARHEQQRRW